MPRDRAALARLREQEEREAVRRAAFAVALAIADGPSSRPADWRGLSVVRPYAKGRRPGRRR